MRAFFKAAGIFAVAKCRDIASSIFWEVAPVFGELLVAGLELWSAFVLTINPNYMHSSPRLEVLLLYAPQVAWQCLFWIVGVLKVFMVVFGTSPDVVIKGKTFPNPFMRTAAAIRDWYIFRIVVLLFCGTALNWFIAYLFSNGGPSIPSGVFGTMGFLSIVAFGNVAYRLFFDWLAERERLGNTNVPLLFRALRIRKAGGV